MKLTAIIEKSGDSYYSIYTAENVAGFAPGGYGSSVAETRQDYMECLDEMRELAQEERKPFPEEIEVEFRYDIP